MRVVHATWSVEYDRVMFWGEDGSLPSPAGRSKGRRPRRPPVHPHPFATAVKALAEDLGALAAANLEAVPEPVVLLLPSERAAPLPSPALVRDAEAEPAALVGLAPWHLVAFSVSAAAAADLLLDLPSAPPPALRLGSDLAALAEVAKLALEAVAHGWVLPELIEDDGRWLARWRPSLPASRQPVVAELAQALPGAARAVVPSTGAGPDSAGAGWEDVALPTAERVVRSALAAFTDALCRAALALSDRGAAPGRMARRAPTGVAEVWMAALGARDPEVRGSHTALESLRRELAGWREAASHGIGPLRVCFRLSAPEPEPAGEANDGARPALNVVAAEATWRLDFVVQSRQDPSLQFEAARVWKAGGGAAAELGTTSGEAQEHLLRQLGLAWRLCPLLEPALRTARPVGLDLSLDNAWRFLREGAPLLEQAGFGVLLPSWWGRPASRLGLKLRARPSAQAPGGTGKGLGQDALFDYDFSAALGDDVVSTEELRRLAALKVPLVRLRGQWVEVRPDDLAEAIAFLERHASGRGDALELLRLASGVTPSPTELPITGFEAEGRLADLLEGDTRLEPLPTPAGFIGELRPYQSRGLAWLAFLTDFGLGACLADDMGLGKTIQMLALLVAEREGPAPQGGGESAGAAPGPTLLVCPMSVVGNWQRETARFAPDLRVQVHHGGNRLGGEAFAGAAAAADLVLTTYGLVPRDLDTLRGVDWHRVVLDEAQNIKNPAAQQTRAVRALLAPQRVALTGTPVENRLSELWSIMEFLNPGLLGGAADFRKRFALPIERYRDGERAAQLKALCGPFILRRLKTDPQIAVELPDKLEMKVYCNLTREQATLYQAVLDEMLDRIEHSEGIERRGLVLATMLKLKQVCNHPAQLLQDQSALEGRSGKLARLAELLEEAGAEGDRALVFTQFAEMGKMLRTYLQARLGADVPFLYGGSSKRARDAMVTRFSAPGGPPVLLVSLKAGGTGLNLTAANHVIHYDRWWNPAVEEQATDRAFRLGQRRDVQVRKLICVGTVEERIDQMIEDKKELAESVVGAGEQWLTELGTAELREALALSRDAVAEG